MRSPPSAYADIPKIVRDRILEIGYDSSTKGFDGASCGVNIAIGAQSPDIAQGVDTAYEARVEGRATRWTAGRRRPGPDVRLRDQRHPELMPLPIALAHRLSRWLTEVRKNGVLPYLQPDGKTQVTVPYDGKTPVRLDTVVLSTQHAADIDLVNLLTPDIRRRSSTPSSTIWATKRWTPRLPAAGEPDREVRARRADGRRRPDRPQDHRRHLRRVGPSRRRSVLRQGSVQGGPFGRVRDALGGKERGRSRPGRPGRGAGGLRDRQGRSGGPVRRDVRHRDRRPGPDREGHHRVFDLRPGAIIRDLDLLRPIYAQTAAYGHFGRTDVELPWEQPTRSTT